MHATTSGADRLEAVHVRVSTGGLAFASRLRSEGLRDVPVDVFVDDQRVQLHHYPTHDAVSLYERGSVRIHDANGMTRAHRSNARPASTKLRWDDLDLLYFVGYALWNYVAGVFGRWALAAHYGREHAAVGDHWIATRRRVLPRTPGGRALPGPTLVWITFDELRRVVRSRSGSLSS